MTCLFVLLLALIIQVTQERPKSRFIDTNGAEKLTDIIKYSRVHKKRINFLVWNSQVCFEDIINMNAAFSVVSIFQNTISASLLSKNSGNESFLRDLTDQS